MQISKKKLNNAIENVAKGVDKQFSEKRTPPANTKHVKSCSASPGIRETQNTQPHVIFIVGKKVKSEEKQRIGMSVCSRGCVHGASPQKSRPRHLARPPLLFLHVLAVLTLDRGPLIVAE